jgi:hypothetical protein
MVPPGDSGVVAAATGDPFQRATCRSDPPAWQDPADLPSARRAVTACRACPVLAGCVAYTADLVSRGFIPAGVVQAAVNWPLTQMPVAPALRRLPVPEGIIRAAG